MRLDNYFFVDVNQKPIIEKEGKMYCIGGVVTGREGFEDGKSIRTSYIVEIDEAKKYAKTKSGSIYELGELNKDYQEMQEAFAKGIPIVENWELSEAMLMKDIPPLDSSIQDIMNTEQRKAIMLKATDASSGDQVYGEVIGQNGNIVTIMVPSEEDYFKMVPKEVFVNWRAMDPFASIELGAFKEVAGIPFEKFEDAFLSKCRPVIMAAS